MKRFLLLSLIVGSMAMILSARAWRVSAAPPEKEMAVVDIPDKTRIAGKVIQGKYIFTHDEEKMAKGGDCFYVYEYATDPSGKPATSSDKLVLSFRCRSAHHEKATHIVLTYGMVNPELFELREIQFAGSTEGHRVPDAKN